MLTPSDIPTALSVAIELLDAKLNPNRYVMNHDVLKVIKYPINRVIVVVFNVTFKQYFSYIVASVLLVEETGIPGENQRPVASH